MKKIALTLMTSVLAPLALSTAPAQAETFCVDFTFFCDGLQLTTHPTAPTLTGTWENLDCFGATAPVQGNFAEVDGSKYRVHCNDPSCPIGEQWLFTLTAFQLGFTFNLFQLDPMIPFQIASPYSVTPGECAFTEQGGTPSWMQ